MHSTVGISVDGAVDPDEVVLVGVFVSVGDVDCEADSVDEAVSVAPVDSDSEGDPEPEEG